MSDPAVPPNHPAGGEPDPRAEAELPPWVRKVLIGLGLSGPAIGWLVGFLMTPEEASPVDLVREVLKAATGPFGATILAVLIMGALAWHHVRSIVKYEAIIESRGEGCRKTIHEKDSKLEESADKTISVFKGTVERYEKVLKEVNARTDQTNLQLIELRAEIKTLRKQIERFPSP